MEADSFSIENFFKILVSMLDIFTACYVKEIVNFALDIGFS